MKTRPFLQLDVFSPYPGAGNPLAVVLDAEGLDDAAMQAIARWTGLPETTFVFPAVAPGSVTHAASPLAVFASLSTASSAPWSCGEKL